MHIKQSLSQFENETALFIVAGKQEAHSFTAHDGVVTELASFSADIPGYTDKPGHFESQNRGKTWKSGSAYDPSNVAQDAKQHVLQQFPDYVADIVKQHTIDSVYLFAPDYMISELKAELPLPLKEKVVVSIQGNYTKHHPLKLIERAEKVMRKNTSSAGKVPVHKIEVRKILGRFFKK